MPSKQHNEQPQTLIGRDSLSSGSGLLCVPGGKHKTRQTALRHVTANLFYYYSIFILLVKELSAVSQTVFTKLTWCICGPKRSFAMLNSVKCPPPPKKNNWVKNMHCDNVSSFHNAECLSKSRKVVLINDDCCIWYFCQISWSCKSDKRSAELQCL